jgi:hypothetical protein
MKGFRFLALGAFLAAVLGGCYMPVRFDAEIEFTRGGYYELIFDGYMADIGLFDGINKGKISPAKEIKKVELIKSDITRDESAKEFAYIEKGHFKANWRKSGDLLRAKMGVFLRRNEKFFSIKYVKTTGLVSMEGVTLAPLNAKRLFDMGLNSEGQIRVKTDAKVVSHNATKIRDKDKAKKIYVWQIKSILDPPAQADHIAEVSLHFPTDALGLTGLFRHTEPGPDRGAKQG